MNERSPVTMKNPNLKGFGKPFRFMFEGGNVMKGVKFWFVVLLCLILSGNVYAAVKIREIELVDGTVLIGKIVSYTDGVYTVDVNELRELEIDEMKIRTIRFETDGNQTQPQNVKTSNSDTSLSRENIEKILRMNPDMRSKRFFYSTTILMWKTFRIIRI